MANTITRNGNFIELSAIDEDWTGESMHINSIQFVPGAANDVLVIKSGSATGPVMCYFKATAATTLLIKEFNVGNPCLPFLDLSDCTLSAGHKVIIEKS